jgi:hypothetical protein
MRLFRQLWNDETGFIISAELVLVATILVIGLIVGMVSLRNQVVEELVDVGQAIGALSQSYAFAGTLGFPGCGSIGAWTDGSGYIDVRDFCQPPFQRPGTPPGGIILDLMPNIDPQGNRIPDFPPGGEVGRGV